ncbi:MAG TPA: hypothetical protein PKW90_10290, partial [Myxococcota bacterium]|nr:hypothetical protein [Myxococcota bacterium]
MGGHRPLQRRNVACPTPTSDRIPAAAARTGYIPRCGGGMLLWSLFLIACSGEESKSELVSTPLFACGDGAVDATEECDEGSANSDSTPDACRSDCRPARCGDRVVDAGESCDDGPELWGGDGCDPACQTEVGPAELEPNDTPETALPVQQNLTLSGSLPEGDRDCYRLELPACGHSPQ